MKNSITASILMLSIFFALNFQQAFAIDFGTAIEEETQVNVSIDELVQKLVSNPLQTQSDLSQFTAFYTELKRQVQDGSDLALVRSELMSIVETNASLNTKQKAMAVSELLQRDGYDAQVWLGDENQPSQPDPKKEITPSTPKPSELPDSPERRITPATPVRQPSPFGPFRRFGHPLEPPYINEHTDIESAEPQKPNQEETRPDRRVTPPGFIPLPDRGPNIPEGPRRPGGPHQLPAIDPRLPSQGQSGEWGSTEKPSTTPEEKPVNPVTPKPSETQRPTRPSEMPDYAPTWPGRPYPHLPPLNDSEKVAIILVQRGLISASELPSRLQSNNGRVIGVNRVETYLRVERDHLLPRRGVEVRIGK